MRLASTPFSLSASLLLASTFVGAQSPRPAPTAPAPHRANEFTLARLRPGRDRTSRASRLYKAPLVTSDDNRQRTWFDMCHNNMLVIDSDSSDKIQSIRLAYGYRQADCVSSPRFWLTGKGLGIGDSAQQLIALYGQPDSRSPSTKAGVQLELLYYAFDWAGPDVPQVMEILCTPEKDGLPGHVVEITLAAPSL